MGLPTDLSRSGWDIINVMGLHLLDPTGSHKLESKCLLGWISSVDLTADQ